MECFKGLELYHVDGDYAFCYNQWMNKRFLLVGAIVIFIVALSVIFILKDNSPKKVQKITDQEAIELVRNTEEVKEWLILFSGPEQTSPKTGGRPAFIVDRSEENYHIIQVLENMPDHVVTFNWYKVNSQTGEVSKEFD